MNIGNELASSRLVYGCMRIGGENSPTDRENGKNAIRAAIEAGYTHFDHADLYGGGHCESIFSEVLNESPGLRDELLITSKCGIRLADGPGKGLPKRYDSSKDYIIGSVEGSLRRLGTDFLDLLLLHRPDFLLEPEEVATAFRQLKDQSKVRHFGVSNFGPSQVSMLWKFCAEPLLVNQVEINISNLDALSNGTLDQCRELGITPMAWSPLGGVAYPADGRPLSKGQLERIHAELSIQSDRYDTESWIVMLAWLLKHPSGILPIIGSTQPERIRAARHALELDYTRADWYRLLQARNGEEVA